MTIVYSGQRSTVWMSAGSIDDAAMASGINCAIKRAIHICSSSSPVWNRPEHWVPDGLKRVKGVYEGDDGTDDEDGERRLSRQRSIEEALSRAGAAADSDDEAKQIEQALQLSMREASRDDDDLQLAEILKMSAEEVQSSSSPSLAVQVRALQELTSCSAAEAHEALLASGNADRAAEALLLKMSAGSFENSSRSSNSAIKGGIRKQNGALQPQDSNKEIPSSSSGTTKADVASKRQLSDPDELVTPEPILKRSREGQDTIGPESSEKEDLNHKFDAAADGLSLVTHNSVTTFKGWMAEKLKGNTITLTLSDDESEK